MIGLLIREAGELGLTCTGEGKATVSFRITPEGFARLFQVALHDIEARPPGETDFGSPAGYYTDESLQTPPGIDRYISNINVVVPETRFDDNVL